VRAPLDRRGFPFAVGDADPPSQTLAFALLAVRHRPHGPFMTAVPAKGRRAPFDVGSSVERPIYMLVEPSNPLYDWFPTIVATIKQIGHDVVSSEVQDGLLRVRTQRSRTFIAVTVEARRVPEGFVVHWEYSDEKRVGWKQRFLWGWAEDPNRFSMVFMHQYKARVRPLSVEVGQRRMIPVPDSPLSSETGAGV
jgi:hypothetical protein